MARRSTTQPDREMTKRDWQALHLTLILQEQIVLYGAVALERFWAAASLPSLEREP